MKLELRRIALRETYTIGNLYIDGKYFCDTLEDKVRDTNKNGIFDEEKKVYGETAIPYGEYKIELKLSPRFKRRLPKLLNVRDFEGILIHEGNTSKDTLGCILLGENRMKGAVVNSRRWVDLLVSKMEVAVKKKENITISVK